MASKLDGKELKQFIDPTLAKAFTHPLRGHIWVTLFERGVVSPAEIASELDLDVSDVSYHFRELKRRKLIRLVRTVQRRGFDEHFYEPITPIFEFDDTEWMKLPLGLRSSVSGESVSRIITQLTEALKAGSFDTRNRHLSQSWLLVDERGWKEAMDAIRRVLEQIQAIQERCAERRKGSTEPGIPLAVVLAAFETAASVSERKAGDTKAL
jgi:DNA-binding transcriptional ArsR family regulator